MKALHRLFSFFCVLAGLTAILFCLMAGSAEPEYIDLDVPDDV